MKLYYKIKTLVALTALLCVANSCTKDFDNINTNPAIVTEDLIKPDNLFSKVLKESIFHIPELGRIEGGIGRISEFAGYMASESSGFPFKNMDYEATFMNYYRSYLININEVIRLTEKPELSNKNAMAKIFRVWLWQNLTDMYGDIPYSEAAKGKADFIAEPKYDKQEAIYKDLFIQLKAATGQLIDDPAISGFGGADILYKGNVNAWRRFANSLRLRMAMRVRFVDNTLAQQNISDVINSPLISANEENAKLLSEGPTAANAGNRSPMINFIKNNLKEPRHIGFTVLEILVLNNDPRVPVYFKLPKLINPSSAIPYRARPINPDGSERYPYGMDSISLTGDFFEAPQFIFNLITAAEVNYLKAEAALAGLAPGDANTFYRTGIQLAMDQYQVPAGSITTFLNAGPATLSGTVEHQFEQIINQKYITLIYQSNEAWAEYRRTGYPKMWLGSAPTDTDGQIPRRQTYPADEYAKNGANVATATEGYPGGDKLTSKVWWDVRAGVPFAHPRQGMFPPESW
ncbi:MAG: SusD/RagB family nutrient-binding outer membrane lipoprotein [Ferruginibacter sp.]